MAEADRFHVLPDLRPWLVMRARILTYDRTDAEDLVHEVLAKFMIAFQVTPVPPLPASRAYLAKCLQNEFISQLRKRKVRDQLSTPLEDVDEGQWLPPPPAFDRPAFEAVDDQEVERAMAKLTPKQREVIERSAAGQRYREIGAALGIPEGAVAKRAFDARGRLREALLEIKREARTRDVSER